MKNIIKKSLQGLLIVPVLALGVSFAVPALHATTANAAFDKGLNDGANSAQGKDQQGSAGCLFGTENGCSGDGIFKTVTNVLLFIIGAISVIMLIIGGIRYVVSGGDSGAVTSAKNTILYAVVGIVVAILAYALVNFVITSFAGQ
jgi:hypothetical protein